jgi:membrane protease YdiL (CAAX protease family)
MKSYQRLLVFLGLMLLLTSLLSPWAAALWQWCTEVRPEWQEYRFPFSNFFNRIFIALGILLFLFCPSLLQIRSLSQLGLSSFSRGYRDLIKGFLLALASVAALILIMSLAGIFTPYLRLSSAAALERTLTALLAAVAAGVLEEIFFRGILLKGLLEDWKPAIALPVVSLFYSAIHFVKPEEKVVLTGIDPWAGIKHLESIFQPFLDPVSLSPGIFGLFLIGVALGYAFIRSGSLYLSIGLHAGWIYGLKTIRVYGDYRRESLGWLFGSSEPKLLSGVAIWIMIVAVGIVIYWITRNRQTL